MTEALSHRLECMLNKYPLSDENIEKRLDSQHFEISWFDRRLEEAIQLSNTLDDNEEYLIQLSD